jgi:hypothetical protein
MKKIKLRHIRITIIGLVTVAMAIAVYTYVRITFNQTKRDTICFEGFIQKLDSGISPEQLVKKDYDTLQLLVEKSLVGRSQMLDVSSRMKVNSDAPISSKDLVILKKGTEDYLNIRKGLYAIANTYECAADVEKETLIKNHIDPKLRMKALMLSLGAALTLYDNYLMGTVFFEHDDRLRKVINDPDMGFGLVANTLREMTISANSIENRYRIRHAIKFYENEKDSIMDSDEDSELAYLSLLIESSASYNYVKQLRIKEVGLKKLGEYERITEDLISESKRNGFNLISELFGNTIGLYESRKGKLFGNEEAKRNIQSMLQPLDILLEKTPFRLTDKLIPGHFGHVAIWTGTKSELIDMGVWNNPIVKQYAEKLNKSSNPDSKEEHQIIEALRNGVQLSTLEHFMNIDDFAILRPIFNDNTKDQLTKEALLLAFRQVGKEYDFNFDVNTTDKIVCSELAYVSYPSIDWPTEKTLGRYNISPDNVAQLAWNNVPLKLIMFYHDGQLVDEEIQVEKMKELMQR